MALLIRAAFFTALTIMTLWCGTPNVVAQNSTVNLTDFGAVGDGNTDCGPALQAALNALAAGGGGTLIVPSGRYAIATPVSRDFAGAAVSIVIKGVESSTPVDTSGGGYELSQPLNLVSEFYPRTGSTQSAISISGLSNLLIKDIAFVGTPDVQTDAANTLLFDGVENATIRHCEFYGLSALLGYGIVNAVRSGLRIEQSKFLGCTGNSGTYTPVVQNMEWKGIVVSNCVFLDYGLRPELFGKLGLSAPIAWILIGNAATTTNNSPRREVEIRDVFLDEGGFTGISAYPGRYQPPSAPIDLIYVTGLRMNVTNLAAYGHHFVTVEGVLVEDSHYGWSQNADSALNLFSVQEAILDKLECIAHANRIRADSSTKRVSVINSVYTFLDSDAQVTNVIHTQTPEEDPVQFVRQRFASVLGREPDPAGHFYWSRLLLQCGQDANCISQKQALFNSYLEGSPAPSFSITGTVSGDNAIPLSGVTVQLTGSQTAVTQTDSNGNYSFNKLPTSGVYSVNVSKTHYTFDQPTASINYAPTDKILNFAGSVDKFAIQGSVRNGSGAGVAGITVTLAGSQNRTTTTDLEGNYSFTEVPVGGTYTATPSKLNYVFTPLNQSVADLSNDQTFDFTLETNTITGRVTKPNGDGLSGTTVTLAGSEAATTTTDVGGNYSFTRVPSGGTYTVTASKLPFVFTPLNQTITNLMSDRTINFSLVTYTISGKVIKPDGSGLPGATVTLSGSEQGTTTTDLTGNYSFTELPAGGTYTVTPSNPSYLFTPLNQTVTNLTSDQTINFTLVTYAITGRVTKAGANGLAGATVTLSGSATDTQTTDTSGNYSFVNLPAGGNYTITASKPNYTCTPAALTVANLNADQIGNFSAQLNFGVPVLLTLPNTTRAVALDSVFHTDEPFLPRYIGAWGTDNRTRIILFAQNFQLAAGEGAEAFTADAEDASGRHYALTVEYVVADDEVSHVTNIVIRLSDDLTDVGDVLLQITFRGIVSNRVRVGIGHIGGGPPDVP